MKNVYFCYDNRVKDQLFNQGVRYVCNAYAKSGKEFWLFLQSPKLTKALEEVC